MKLPLWSQLRSVRHTTGEWLEWALWMWLAVIVALALDVKSQPPSPEAQLVLAAGSQAPRLQASK